MTKNRYWNLIPKFIFCFCIYFYIGKFLMAPKVFLVELQVYLSHLTEIRIFGRQETAAAFASTGAEAFGGPLESNWKGTMLGSYLRRETTLRPDNGLGATSKITYTVSSRKQCNSSGALSRPFLNSSVRFVFNNSCSPGEAKRELVRALRPRFWSHHRRR